MGNPPPPLCHIPLVYGSGLHHFTPFRERLAQSLAPRTRCNILKCRTCSSQAAPDSSAATWSIAASRRHRRHHPRQLRSVLRRGDQGAEHRAASRPSALRLLSADIRDAARAANWTVTSTPSCIWPPRAGVRPSIADPFAIRTSTSRHAEPAGAGPGAGHPAVRLRLVKQRLRHQPERAVERSRSRAPANQPVRQHEGERRAARPRLQSPVRHPVHRAALLHRVRSAAATRPGDSQVRAT